MLFFKRTYILVRMLRVPFPMLTCLRGLLALLVVLLLLRLHQHAVAQFIFAPLHAVCSLALRCGCLSIALRFSHLCAAFSLACHAHAAMIMIMLMHELHALWHGISQRNDALPAPHASQAR